MFDLQIPRESKEFVQVAVNVDGVAVVSGVEIAITVITLSVAARPTIYFAPTSLSGKLGVLVGPGTNFILLPGLYQVWARVTSSPEIPVVELANRIQIT